MLKAESRIPKAERGSAYNVQNKAYYTRQGDRDMFARRSGRADTEMSIVFEAPCAACSLLRRRSSECQAQLPQLLLLH